MAFERADGLAGAQVPEPQRVVLRARDGTATVGSHRYTGDRVCMAFERADQGTSCRGKTGRQRSKPRPRFTFGSLLQKSLNARSTVTEQSPDELPGQLPRVTS